MSQEIKCPHCKKEFKLKDSIAASALGKKGGASTSEAKSKSSAENGKKGGRPKKILIP